MEPDKGPQQRLFMFLILTMGILWYMNWQEGIRQQQVAAAKKKQAEEEAAKLAKAEADKPTERKPQLDKDGKPVLDKDGKPVMLPVAKPAEPKPQLDKDGKPVMLPAAKPAEAAPPPVPAVKLREDLVLGRLGSPDDPTNTRSPYRQFVRLTNRGAGVSELLLNRHWNEEKTGPLELIGHGTVKLQKDPLAGLGQSFTLNLPAIAEEELNSKNWEVVESSEKKVVFRTLGFKGKVEITKTFTLDEESDLLGLTIAFRNVSAEPVASLEYDLYAANGLPLEGRWYTRYFRKFVGLMETAGGSGVYREVDAPVVQKATTQPRFGDVTPVRSAGVIDKYFASMVSQPKPLAEIRQAAWAEPFLVAEGIKPEHGNVTARIRSAPIKLDPAAEVIHEWRIFNGPKDGDSLSAHADTHLDLLIHYYDLFYILPVGWIARLMVWLLGMFHLIFGDYGVAIIGLVLIVRTALLPLSIKQTLAMLKMQSVQPMLEELKKKHEEDAQGLNKAMMELYRREGVNPFGACLMPLLQLPIFVGLYQALDVTFALRQSTPFYGVTWIRDLSAPDKLFAFGADIPYLGPYFNLLPIFSAVQQLFIMHYTLPKPTTEEQRIQQSTMKWMIGFMSFLFFWVPAGLCVYFITQGIYGIAERLFLERYKKNLQAKSGEGDAAVAKPSPSAPAPNSKPASWLKTTGKSKSKNR